MAADSQVRSLAHAILIELYKTAGIDQKKWLRTLIEPLIWIPAIRFSRLAVQFDDLVAREGLVAACRAYLPIYVESLIAQGECSIPTSGPVMVLSNHPGVFDGFAIVSCFPRDDFKIIISGVPFTRAVPASSQYLIYVPPDPQGRMAMVRLVIRHLQSGGMILLFPSGRVDPDPTVLPGAIQALQDWSPSVEIFLRKFPKHRL